MEDMFTGQYSRYPRVWIRLVEIAQTDAACRTIALDRDGTLANDTGPRGRVCAPGWWGQPVIMRKVVFVSVDAGGVGLRVSGGS